MGRGTEARGATAPRGREEAERQVRVARRLYAEGGADRPWEKLAVQDRRPWIDRACDAAHRDETA